MPEIVLYVPVLHRSFAPRTVPAQVAFFSGSNADDATVPQSVRMTEQAIQAALPLSPAEARAALDDMLRLGETYAADGMLQQMAANESLRHVHKRKGVSSAELKDLDSFAASGAYQDNEDAGSGIPDWKAGAERAEALAKETKHALLSCQQVLLLVAHHEEQQLEAQKLWSRVTAAESALKDALGEAQPGADKHVAEDADAPDRAAQTLDWRVIVDAIIPFIPEKAVLFTQCTRMTKDLQAAGMLQPFPEDRACLCEGWPQELVGGLLFASVPAWRLVGRKYAPPERPWLQRELELVVARPEGGWLQ